MKKSNIILILFIMIGGIVMQGSMIYCASTKTSITYTSKDSYIDSEHPSTNYGDAELWVGDFILISTDCLYYTYVYFDLGSQPSNVMQAQLILYCWAGSGSAAHPIQVSIYYTDESWNEYTITWLNAPALGTKLGTYSVTSVGSLSFNITNADFSESSITFVLTTLTRGQSIIMYSKDSQSIFNDDEKPHILWTYLKNESIPSFPVFLIIGICILITMPIIIKNRNKTR